MLQNNNINLFTMCSYSSLLDTSDKLVGEELCLETDVN